VSQPYTRKDWARRILSLLDLTSLNDTDTDETVIALCEQALESPIAPAAVCVGPKQALVPVIVLRDSPIKTATVANFPSGALSTAMTSFEILRSVNDGVEEIDVVFPYRAFGQGQIKECTEFLEAAKSACGVLAHLKVILETGEIEDPEMIEEAAKLAIECGADFLKTSTGKVAVNATLEASEILLKTIKSTKAECGFKAAGGIKTLEDAVAYVRLSDEIMGPEWTTAEHFRIGASSLMKELLLVLDEDTDEPFDDVTEAAASRELPQEIIRRKRNGEELSETSIKDFIDGVTDGSVNDAQVAAFAMSVFFKDMTDKECSALTLAMRDSGEVMDWKSVGLGDAPIIDKHSTGGVGDKVSLILAPLVAACGVKVPMISGRGLGHTGGTLDKLASIPRYNAIPSRPTLTSVIKRVGCAIMGQTDDLAPADRRMYAIRDISGSVESLPLIVASILSKKLAAGLTGLVFDVKAGSGAFMQTDEEASALANRLVKVAKEAGLPARALITDMNQVLGTTAGNSLEVAEAVAFLKGEAQDPYLKSVTMALAIEMLQLAGMDAAEAQQKADAALASGAAAETFGKMVSALAGPNDFMDNTSNYLGLAPIVKPVYAAENGVIASMDVREIGISVIDLGGGRTHHDQPIDLAVGLTDIQKVGHHVAADQPICMVHARDEHSWERAAERIRKACKVGAEKGAVPDLIRAKIV